MRVYHGTTTWKMASLFSGDFSKRFPGLFVTDTFERAARYANSQSAQKVTTRTLPLSSCAVVVSIETDDPLHWLRRSEDHPSLDQCEALIQHGEIVEVCIGRPGPLSYTEQQHVQEAQQLHCPVRILESIRN